MKKLVLLIALFAVAIALSGCVQPPICGNGICELGESQTCDQDCATSICGNGIVEKGEECDQSLCGPGLECSDCTCIIVEPNCSWSASACVEASECPGFIGPLRVGESYTPTCENGCCGFDHVLPDGSIAPTNPVPPGPLTPPTSPFLPIQ